MVHPGAPRGLLDKKPEPRPQDKEARPAELYCVAFFPKINIGSADINFYSLDRTLSQSPETAVAKFMDGMAKDQKWETFSDAGHRVRKVRIIDLGDAPNTNLNDGGNVPASMEPWEALESAE